MGMNDVTQNFMNAFKKLNEKILLQTVELEQTTVIHMGPQKTTSVQNESRLLLSVMILDDSLEATS